MKKVLKVVIALIIIVVCWKAYQSTQKNDTSFFSNVGKESKGLVEDVKNSQIIDKTKQAGKEIKEGFEE
jgi:uncharacterized protein YxeA